MHVNPVSVTEQQPFMMSFEVFSKGNEALSSDQQMAAGALMLQRHRGCCSFVVLHWRGKSEFAKCPMSMDRLEYNGGQRCKRSPHLCYTGALQVEGDTNRLQTVQMFCISLWSFCILLTLFYTFVVI